MNKRFFAESELIINADGSVFHLHVKPENLADKIILVGDPGRVTLSLHILTARIVMLRAASFTPLPALLKANA